MLYGSSAVHLSKPPAPKLADAEPTEPPPVAGQTKPLPSATKPSGAPPTATAAPSDTPHQYANLLDDECPWCIAMRSGPCGRQFATWQRCVKDIRAEQEQRAASSLSSFSLSAAERQKREEAEYQRECMDYFRRSTHCRHSTAQHTAPLCTALTSLCVSVLVTVCIAASIAVRSRGDTTASLSI